MQEEEGVKGWFGRAESQVPVGHLAGDVPRAGRALGVELGREASGGMAFR